MVVVSNFEIEHFFTKRHMKLRIGRLSNTVSESQYFGRVALGESSAHLQGNFIYVNDAFEWDGRFKNGTGVYFVGMQPYFKPLKFKGFYAISSQAYPLFHDYPITVIGNPFEIIDIGFSPDVLLTSSLSCPIVKSYFASG